MNKHLTGLLTFSGLFVYFFDLSAIISVYRIIYGMPLWQLNQNYELTCVIYIETITSEQF